MTRQNNLRHTFVEYIPEKLEPRVLYISRKYSTASHLCCCGCGFRVVTPLNPAKWKLTDHGNTVSLHPSIGNWSFPCKSHYWIDHDHIRWAAEMSERQITHVRRKDRMDAEQYAEIPEQQITNVNARNQTDAEHHANNDINILSRFVSRLLKRWFGGN